MLQYLSVCSGIEAASVAWHPLGFKPIGFSEIEPFPSAVLASRFTSTRNFGDMNGYQDWPIKRGSIDVLVGGTPCQSFSVAGMRRGMADPRGNLALVYLAIADKYRPQWIVWENVPGVLSSNRGRDFGSFLGALVQLGYGFAYRVLDAQFFGVPQRRRRVFVVGHLGDWRRAAAVLFERESLLRNTSTRRDKKQETARTLRARANASHREDSDNYVTHTLRGAGHDASEDGTGRGTPLVACTLPASDGGVSSGLHPVVAFNARQDPDSWVDRIGPLDTDGTTHAVAFTCKDYGADAGELCPTLRSMNASSANANAGSQVAIAYQCQGSNVGPMGTLRAGNGNETGGVPFIAGTLQSGRGYRAEEAWTGQLIPLAISGRARGDDGRGYARPEHISEVAGTVDTVKPESVLTPSMAVRRLTPRECERLQGFPDDWTLIEYRGKPAADGPRYKAIGNSMAVPVMRWIGKRILLVEGAMQHA